MLSFGLKAENSKFIIQNSSIMLQKLFCPLEHRMKHLPRELAREGILLAGMVRAQQRDVAVQFSDRAVAELRPGLGNRPAVLRVSFEEGVEGDFSQRDDDAHPLQQLKLPHEIR